jgi:hypothetical protein
MAHRLGQQYDETAARPAQYRCPPRAVPPAVGESPAARGRVTASAARAAA